MLLSTTPGGRYRHLLRTGLFGLPRHDPEPSDRGRVMKPNVDELLARTIRRPYATAARHSPSIDDKRHVSDRLEVEPRHFGALLSHGTAVMAPQW